MHNLWNSIINIPVHPLPPILPSPLNPEGQIQTNPSSGELTHEAISVQSANVHGSATQPVPLILPSPKRPNGQRQTNCSPFRESMQVDPSTQSAWPLEQEAMITMLTLLIINSHCNLHNYQTFMLPAAILESIWLSINDINSAVISVEMTRIFNRANKFC